MADISGVKITDLTACGASDDGEHIWITHRLGDGTEYPLIYPFESVGYLITVLADAARSAQRRRVARDPREAEEGANTEVIPVQAARVGTSPIAMCFVPSMLASRSSSGSRTSSSVNASPVLRMRRTSSGLIS